MAGPFLRRSLLTASVSLLLAGALAAQRSSTTFQGSWTATAGATVLHGTWAAQIAPGAPNVAIGSWLMSGPTGAIVMQGTWSARKAADAWRGTWSARTKEGRMFAGTWDTPVPDARMKTFADLLQGTVSGQVAGGWHVGPASGGWILKGTAR